MHKNSPAVVHLIQNSGRSSFGLGAVALNLAVRQAQAGLNTHVWSLDDETELRWLVENTGIARDLFRPFPRSGPPSLGYSPRLERYAAGPQGADVSIVHQHGIWTFLSRVTVQWKRQHHGLSVVAAHGALDDWALRKSWWKKRLALAAYERENLENANCLHALSEQEIKNYRQLGFHNPIAFIPNGISEEWIDSPADSDAFRRELGVGPDTRLILFLSRITPKKGLPMLIEALASLQGQLESWQLVVAGADEFHHEQEVRALVNRLGLSGHVLFPGPLFGDAKRAAFAACELFVLPSYSEGSPMVILEALGAALPVIATSASPWPQLPARGCGWWTEISRTAIAMALEEALRKSPADLARMGRRGRDLVRTEYSWTVIGQKTLDLYAWLLGDGRQPDFVTL